MNNIALGNFDLIASKLLQETTRDNSSKERIDVDSCQIPLLVYKLFPYLLDYFNKATEIGNNGTSKDYKRSKNVLGAHLESEVLPRLKKMKNFEETDDILSELYLAFPDTKSLIHQIKTDLGDDNSEPTIFALPIIGYIVAAAVVYGVGYAVGYFLG